VRITVPTAEADSRLTRPRQIPIGTKIQTSGNASVEIRSAQDDAGKTYAESTLAGRFTLNQVEDAEGVLTQLELGRPEDCSRSKRARASMLLYDRGYIRSNVRYSARGRYFRAASRGTVWRVTEECDRARIAVEEGTVEVFDERLGRTIAVTPGTCYEMPSTGGATRPGNCGISSLAGLDPATALRSGASGS
jgi:hypothetical protein